MATRFQGISRKRFVAWFVTIGILLPFLLIVMGTFTEHRLQWKPEGSLGTTLWILTWIVWPSWILMMDAEHLAQTIVMLILSALLNGLYYGILGFLIWHVQHRRGPQSS